jgi:hypothetical protein
MKNNPDWLRPGDPDARRGSVSIVGFTVVTVTDVAVFRTTSKTARCEDLQKPCTLTERVLTFLNRRAA